MSSFTNRYLKVKARTWTRDSYGLYDYEATNFNSQTLAITKPSNLTRNDNEVIQFDNNNTPKGTLIQEEHKENLPYLSFKSSSEGIKIVPIRKEDQELEHDFWYVVDKKEHTRGRMLREHDIVRLGRIIFKITKIRVVKEKEVCINPYQNSIIENIKEHMKKEDTMKKSLSSHTETRASFSSAICKICLSEATEKDDPLITPCKCMGSVKYVHLKCVQNWVKSKLNMQQNKNIVTIFWKDLNCELCKEKLPINIMHEGEELSLIPIGNKIKGSYVVMESFSKEHDSTGIHMIDLSSNQDLKMGRGPDCELKIPDISVSRVHALLTVSKGNLYIKDNHSKFGTLVLQKGPIVVNDEHQKTPWIQCGRTVFKFVIKKPWVAFLPCVGSLFGKSQKVNKKIGEIGSIYGGGAIQFAQEEEAAKRHEEVDKKHEETDNRHFTTTEV